MYRVLVILTTIVLMGVLPYSVAADTFTAFVPYVESSAASPLSDFPPGYLNPAFLPWVGFESHVSYEWENLEANPYAISGTVTLKNLTPRNIAIWGVSFCFQNKTGIFFTSCPRECPLPILRPGDVYTGSFSAVERFNGGWTPRTGQVVITIHQY